MGSKLFKNIVHYDENTTGRDFVVGDIHGCYEDLLKALTLLGFVGGADRLFSVGDLVDRGPDSFKAAELVFEPWFKAVKGNHEELMFETLLRNSTGHRMTWISNGGQWYSDIEPIKLKDVARALEQLPFVITVGEGENRFNIVHAELIHQKNWNTSIPLTDKMIDDWVFSDDELSMMTWGRTLITAAGPLADMKEGDWSHDMDKMSLTFVGHTPVNELVQVQKQMYIDTGAVYYHTSKNKSENRFLSIACPAEKQVYQYNLMWKTLTTVSFDDIKKLG